LRGDIPPFLRYTRVISGRAARIDDIRQTNSIWRIKSIRWQQQDKEGGIMKYIGLVLSWLFALLFGLFALSMVLMGNLLQAVPLLGITLLLLPPVRSLLHKQAGKSVSPWVYMIAVVVLLAMFSWIGSISKLTTIYKSPQVKARFMEIYDAKMEEWPVPYESVYLDTSYGQVHVIVSGPEDAPPMLLLHASGVAGWSWTYNVEELSQHYRTYAIDLIGDAGRSEYDNLDNRMEDGQDQAELYTEITDQLGVDKAYVVGASEGGFVGSNYALYAPGRVEKLALLGPMGYAGATRSIVRIMFAQFFPLRPIQESTFGWAFGHDPKLEEAFGDWFRLFLTCFPQKVAPWPLKPEERQSIQVPVLFVFGERDNLVGDPVQATALVQDMKDVRVEVLDAGHLIGAEQPEQVNALLIEFCK
jgi:pimeloyl-ACP methyl ester carboxylesterase